jgi:hypothetical protein
MVTVSSIELSITSKSTVLLYCIIFVLNLSEMTCKPSLKKKLCDERLPYKTMIPTTDSMIL